MIARKQIIATCIVTILLSYFSISIVQAETKQEQKIIEYEKEDTYLFETTDSIITTKINLTRKLPEVIGKYAREEYPIPNISQTKNEEMYELIKTENREIMNNVLTDIQNGTLKKHIAADGQFYGSVPNDATAVEKIAYINTNLKGSHSLGVYIPAGEIATITIPEEFLYLAEQGKMNIKVGMTETNAENYGKNNRKENRMPYLGKSFTITGSTLKVGTPFGGMIYLNFATNVPDGLTIPVTINGAIDTPYYDLGRTTLQEWNDSKNAPGLYAEFRTPYLRMMLPSSTIRNIENPYDILSFWHKVASLSTYPYGAQKRTLPVTMIFDPYVKAGAAVATVGAWVCNMPTGWASSSLNYESFMKNGGWGTIHEFNHHWQGTYNTNGRWGVGSVGEVTNNVMSSASYILYTNIDSYRTTKAFDGWNNVVNPYYNLQKVINESKKQKLVSSVYMYVSFMHEFGVENFLEVIKSNYSGGTYHGITLARYNPEETREGDFAYRCSAIFGKDLTSYFKDTLHFTLSNSTIEKIKKLGFETYIPVQNLYATGPVGIETGKPFYILNQSYEFDFKSTTATTGKLEKIEVGKPLYGTLTQKEDGIYTYQRNKNLPEGTIDEFPLTITVSQNGITQTRKFTCKIGLGIENYKFEAPEPKYQRDIYKIGNQIKIDMTKATILSAPNPQNDEGNLSSSMIDGNLNTYFHSRYSGSNITPFPHEYKIDLGEQKEFNHFSIYTRSNNTNGAVGDYQLWISNDNQNWTKIVEDNGRKQNSSSSVTISKQIENTKARYLKLVALNNKFGNNFTIISEIELGNQITNKTKIPHNSSYLSYEGDWIRKEDGNYINGAVYASNSGNVTYFFIGSQTGIYSSTDATIEVKIDNNEPKSYEIKGSKYEPSFLLNQLEEGKHTIQIKVIKGELGLNLVTTNGDFIYPESKILKGDINLDKKISPTDLLLLKRHLVAGNNTEWILTNQKWISADINDDNKVSPTDLLLLKRLILKNIGL